MNFVTYEQMIQSVYRNLHKIPRDVDLVVGIPRSGMLVANVIALDLNLPFTDLDSFIDGRLIGTGDTRKRADWIQSVQDAKHILVVDDSISKGDAIKKAKKKVRESFYTGKVSYCVAYALPTNFACIDIFFEICNHPRMFEWNYLHHWGLKNTCMDIDGVLCKDPTFLQNDDGKKYVEFLRSAEPYIIPTKPVGYLVTGRLEKYREETEQWLKENRVQYDQLIMLDCESAKSRAQISQGAFKAEIYRQKKDCFLFIESSLEQALEICKITGKQVYCTENHVLINPENYLKYFGIYSRDLKITCKRVIKKLLKKT